MAASSGPTPGRLASKSANVAHCPAACAISISITDRCTSVAMSIGWLLAPERDLMDGTPPVGQSEPGLDHGVPRFDRLVLNVERLPAGGRQPWGNRSPHLDLQWHGTERERVADLLKPVDEPCHLLADPPLG